MSGAIAVVGMACRYPDANSPQMLWENALAQRRSFRRMPPERLRLADYYSPRRDAPDRVYSTEASLLTNYQFDRLRFRVAGSTFRATDLTHWLALEVASEALADAGFPNGDGLSRSSTGVLIGNTLTGEFSRAALMRLRWPFVRRVVDSILRADDVSPAQRQKLLERLEAEYKAPFEPVGEDTLAGGLANTIAGRICNYFDFGGGGLTLDGACSSSLLAVSQACTALAAGDADVMLAGGVDLSLDPFELVGFAKTGALAPEEMRIYDARSAGFWPGEGCGVVVLMRQADAERQGRRVYATIAGWGVSSDGKGGLTRPEVSGQVLALRRAYARAAFGIETVPLFEGHGTGTAVGDAVELEALTTARRDRGGSTEPAVIGSIKANIGHTKAAAGMAGMIKAIMALQAQILPPTTGCETPHPVLSHGRPELRVLPQGEPWPADLPLRAGVSAMGFGGINAHLVLERSDIPKRSSLTAGETKLLASGQDAEAIFLSAPDREGLRSQITRLLEACTWLSRAELADLATQSAQQARHEAFRAAVVASTPAELRTRLQTLLTRLEQGDERCVDVPGGIFLGTGSGAPRIGVLFPGQGAPVPSSGGAVGRRFPAVQELYATRPVPTEPGITDTALAQPGILQAEIAALRVLKALGIEARVAVGHSLGEIAALHWAGAIDEETALRIVRVRGEAMSALNGTAGAMASIGAAPAEVERLLRGDSVSIACFNSPHQTVISGEEHAVLRALAEAQRKGWSAVRLPVSRAFHSPLVADAAAALGAELRRCRLAPLSRRVASTVTGDWLEPDADLSTLLERQVTEPVRFTEAIARACDQADLWIEAGPGRILSGLASEGRVGPSISLEMGGMSWGGLLRAVGAAYALGAPVRPENLVRDRFSRPLDPDRRPQFLVNPCELAPVPAEQAAAGQPVAVAVTAAPVQHEPAPASSATAEGQTYETVLETVRRLVVQRAELPLEAVAEGARLLDDLHFSSIVVGQVVVAAARELGLQPPVAPSEYAGATVGEVARALLELAETGGNGPDRPPAAPAGLAPWVRPFAVQLVEEPRKPPTVAKASAPGHWEVFGPVDPLVHTLRRTMAEVPGDGVVLCLPPTPGPCEIPLMLEAAREVLRQPAARFVLVQQGGGGAAFARTLHLETQRPTCVVDLPYDAREAAEWVAAEAAGASGYAEVHYGADAVRRVPIYSPVSLTGLDRQAMPLGPDDVLLVTGGGKGIGAECAIDLACRTGARLILLGRSEPGADRELTSTLERMKAAAIPFHYISADVLDARAVAEGIREAEGRIGPVTAVLHAAGANSPKLLQALHEEEFQRTVSVKVDGLATVLAAVDPNRLRLLVTFGSVIARTGMRGEADYATANEWLVRLTEDWRKAHPHCRCLAVEWSVWSGVGMGERLNRVESLVREGITPISPEQGVQMLADLLCASLEQTAVVVTGRFGGAPTVRLEDRELPLWRFLEQPRVYYPGLELVVDLQLSAGSDPYLNDHAYQGELLFPAVMGLEAIAQVAMAVTGRTEPPALESVRFERPTIVPAADSLTVRLAALVMPDGRVEVALRTAESNFAVDHVRAVCNFAASAPLPGDPPVVEAPPVPLEPADLYGRLLFQRGRFRRVLGYRLLRATECVADLSPGTATAWFGQFLPQALRLGDPGSRDASLHAVQACVPDATILPVNVDRWVPGPGLNLPGPFTVHARERLHEGDRFVYDLALWTHDGTLREVWEGLTLRKVRQARQTGAWVPTLLGPYLERACAELSPPCGIAVVVERSGLPERRDRSDRAMQRALGSLVRIIRRADGKPVLAGKQAVSASHANEVTLAVAGECPVGCDMQAVAPHAPETWQELLGAERFRLAQQIAREQGEEIARAATRVWAAAECLKKAGAGPTDPLRLQRTGAGDWVFLTSGRHRVATVVAEVDQSGPMVLAVSGGDNHASL